MNNFVLKTIEAKYFNKWQAERHYLKRPIIRTKMVAHGIYIDNELVGGLLWATPHFIKKKGLFGYSDLLDKWEVLVLSRFYLIDECEVIATQAMSQSIGKGNGNRGSKRRGWRLQEDWVREHPPKYPQNPYVPRLLISWSDKQWGHEGIIYRANGWEEWDTTNSNGQRTDKGTKPEDGEKKCWILRLGPNPRAHKIGQDLTAMKQLDIFQVV